VIYSPEKYAKRLREVIDSIKSDDAELSRRGFRTRPTCSMFIPTGSRVFLTGPCISC